MSKGYHGQATDPRAGDTVYENHCRGKQHYRSKRHANGRIRVVLRNGDHADDGTLHSYKCPSCKRWHIGHRRGSRA